jgi:hypothetical protein
MAFLNHHEGDIPMILPASPVGREEAGVMAFLNHHEGDIPVILLSKI